MFAVFKSAATREPTHPKAQHPAQPLAPLLSPTAAAAAKLSAGWAKQASVLCREAAEVRGAIDDAHQVNSHQAQTVHALALRLLEVVKSQNRITHVAGLGLEAAAKVGDAVHAVGAEVGGMTLKLREMSDAASQLTQIALQTRLLAFNASLESRRAGDAGRSFGAVALAMKDLADRVDVLSKGIVGTAQNLDSRITVLTQQLGQSRPGVAQGLEQAEAGTVHHALDQVVTGVSRIYLVSEKNRDLCEGLNRQMAGIEADMRHGDDTLGFAVARTETLLKTSEQLMQTVAQSGVQTDDTPYIRAAQDAAAHIAQLLESAVQCGSISQADLFEDNYVVMGGTQPTQHQHKTVTIAERLFPPVQEQLLGLSDKVVFCIVTDRHGYVACHNKAYNQPQRPGDTAYNSVHCRNRRIFNDRSALASARSRQPFLLQTYRRDLGAGNFVVMKEAAAPITVGGQHWGALRLAFKF
jgi:methyl-accepting chemotaxis protein